MRIQGGVGIITAVMRALTALSPNYAAEANVVPADLCCKACCIQSALQWTLCKQPIQRLLAAQHKYKPSTGTCHCCIPSLLRDEIRLPACIIIFVTSLRINRFCCTHLLRPEWTSSTSHECSVHWNASQQSIPTAMIGGRCCCNRQSCD